MREHLNAVVLASAIEITPVTPPIVEVEVPAVRRTVRAVRAPLDLNADVYRYRTRPDSTIVAVRTRPRICREPHQRRLD